MKEEREDEDEGETFRGRCSGEDGGGEVVEKRWIFKGRVKESEVGDS